MTEGEPVMGRPVVSSARRSISSATNTTRPRACTRQHHRRDRRPRAGDL